MDIDIRHLMDIEFAMNGEQSLCKVWLDISDSADEPKDTLILSHILSGRGILGEVAVILDNADKSYMLCYRAGRQLTGIKDKEVTGHMLKILKGFIDFDKRTKGM